MSNLCLQCKKIVVFISKIIFIPDILLHLYMPLPVKHFRLGWINSLSLLSMFSLLALQSIWLYNTYQLVHKQFIGEANEAFIIAYEKEQTYRLPIGNIGNTLTVQECGKEEVRIIRYCPEPDTITYRNNYGLSFESVINRAFYELRERITPLNIHCLADLFAGALFERGIQADFVIEKWNPATGDVLSTSATPDVVKPAIGKNTYTLCINISETEELRTYLHFEQISVFRQMTGIIVISLLLLLITIMCVGYQLRIMRRQNRRKETIAGFTNELLARIETIQYKQAEPVAPSTIFRVGQYIFDADRNELYGFDKITSLNKKEDAILLDLCSNMGKVIERSVLLEKYWGNAGFLYSRSLNTYVTRLRKYLKEDPKVQIVAIKGLGYKLIVGEA